MREQLKRILCLILLLMGYGFGWKVIGQIPVAQCSTAITVFLDSTGQATISAAEIDSLSTPSTAGLSLSDSIFHCSNLGPNVVTLFVRNGPDVDSCTSRVNVVTDSSCEHQYHNCSTHYYLTYKDDVLKIDINGVESMLEWIPIGGYWNQRNLNNCGPLTGDCKKVRNDAGCCIMVYPWARNKCLDDKGRNMPCSDSCAVLCNGDSTGKIITEVGGGVPPYSFIWSTGSTNANLINVPAGTYTVTITDAIGQISVGSFTVTEPAPITLAIDSIIPDCPPMDSSGAIYLTTSGGCGPYTYAWSNGDSLEDIDSLSSGFYRVTVTDHNGCQKIDSFEVTNDFAAFSDSTLGLTAYFTNESHFCNNYSWNFGDGGTSTQENPVHNYASSGTYNVCLVLNCPPCTDTICDSITVTAVGRRDPNVSIPGLTIHPNPTKEKFWLNAQIPLRGRIQMQINDLSVRRHLSQSFSGLSGKIPVDIQSLPAGLYFVEITTESGARKTFKLVVQ